MQELKLNQTRHWRHPRLGSEHRSRGKPWPPIPYADLSDLSRAAGTGGTLENPAVQPPREAGKTLLVRAVVCEKDMMGGNRFP